MTGESDTPLPFYGADSMVLLNPIRLARAGNDRCGRWVRERQLQRRGLDQHAVLNAHWSNATIAITNSANVPG